MTVATPLVIGIAGPAGAGKDTVALRLLDAWQRSGLVSAAQISFADPIRNMLRAMGVPLEYMTDRALKEQTIPGIGRSYRHLAQTLGTEWGRAHVSPELWLDLATQRLEREAAAAAPNRFVAVISDIRFPNEVRWLRRRAGILLRIDRPGLAPVAAHASESNFDSMNADVDICNSLPLDQLHALVDDMATGLVYLAQTRIFDTAHTKRQERLQ